MKKNANGMSIPIELANKLWIKLPNESTNSTHNSFQLFMINRHHQIK